MRFLVTDELVSNPDFSKQFTSNIIFDSNTRELTFLSFDLSTVVDVKRILQLMIDMAPGQGYSRVCFEDVVFFSGKFSLSYSAPLVFSGCQSTSKANFLLRSTEISINNSDFFESHMDIRVNEITVDESRLGLVDISGELRLFETRNTVEFQGLNGLDKYLSSELTPVIYFSTDIQIYKNANLSYRVLKSIASKNTDYSQMHLFHNLILSISPLNFEDKILRSLSKYTNDHGQSWFSPLVLMFLVNFIFILIYSSQGVVDSAYPIDKIISIFNINPLNSLVQNDVDGLDWLFAADSVRRMLLVILTYQIVSAARRFSFMKR